MKPRQTRPKLVQAIMDAFRMPDLRRRILLTFAMFNRYKIRKFSAGGYLFDKLLFCLGCGLPHRNGDNRHGVLLFKTISIQLTYRAIYYVARY